MKPRALLLLTILLATATARADTLVTLDGRVLDGQVRFEKAALVVTLKSGGEAKIEVANLMLLSTESAGRLQRGVVFTSGAVMPIDAFSKLDGVTLRMTRGKDKLDLPLSDIAVLVFDSAAATARFPAGDSPGVLLKSGDFFEGEVVSLAGKRLGIGSTLFGDRTFDVEKEVVAVKVHAGEIPKIPRSATRIELKDGTIASPAELKMDNGRLMFTDPRLGAVTAGREQVDELRIGSKVRPLRVDGSTSAEVRGPAAVWGSGASAKLKAGEALRVALGGEVAGAYFRVGVPRDLLPVQQVRFVVEVDGKVMVKTPLMSSVDDAVAVAVACGGKQELVVRVEAESGGEAAVGVVVDGVQAMK